MKRIKFLDLVDQYSNIDNEIDLSIKDVIRNAAYIGGSFVEKFENEFAKFLGVKNVIGVGNGTDALEIVIEALEIPKGSEIIVPANSFISSAEAVSRCGHKVVFCDCDLENLTLSTDDVQKCITSKTKAIVAVHLYGHPCELTKLNEICSKHDLFLIEDCAQAHGAFYREKHVGSLSDAGTFSFYPGKNLGAFGDGGAISTNNHELAIKCRMIANHGRMKKYDHLFEGRNSRLDGIQSAILSVKLKHLHNWVNKRNDLAYAYTTKLKDLNEIKLPFVAKWAKHAFHLYVIRTTVRDRLKTYLEKRGIETGIHYPIALPNLKAYAYLENSKKFNASNISNELLSLPIGEHLSIGDVDYVVSTIKNFYKEL